MLRVMLLGVGVAVMIAAPTYADPAPVFAASPSEADIFAAYPPAALAAGWGGHAVLSCRHDAEGLLTNCKTVGSDHGYPGFREAGLKLVARFRLDMTEPRKTPKTVNLTIRFVPPIERPEREPKFAKVPTGFGHLAPVGPYWPEVAVRKQITGLSVIDCKVEGDGRLRECRFIAEDPAEVDFSAAALRMSASGYLTAGPPMAGAVKPSDDVWRITVEFRAPKNWK